ncbi:hypothetical protein [Acidovorax sp. LjRoot117]
MDDLQRNDASSLAVPVLPGSQTKSHDGQRLERILLAPMPGR